MMTIDEHIEYWLDTADKDLEVAESLLSNGHFLHCLYFGHLIIEKALKAYWVYVFQASPPKIHDLLKLALKTSINLPESDLRFLDELNKFNIEARYPEYKLEMYKICDSAYSQRTFTKLKELYQCIKSQITLPNQS